MEKISRKDFVSDYVPADVNTRRKKKSLLLVSYCRTILQRRSLKTPSPERTIKKYKHYSNNCRQKMGAKDSQLIKLNFI